MGIVIGLLAWCSFGLVIGIATYGMLERPQPLGAFLPISLATTGAVIGGLLGWVISGSPLDPVAWIAAIVVSILASGLYFFIAPESEHDVHR